MFGPRRPDRIAAAYACKFLIDTVNLLVGICTFLLLKASGSLHVHNRQAGRNLYRAHVLLPAHEVKLNNAATHSWTNTRKCDCRRQDYHT
jgi:hypothetical protein